MDLFASLTDCYSSGIGHAICSILAANNCKVYLGARSEQRAKDAIAKIDKGYPSVKEKGNVVRLKLDPTELKDIIAAAKEFIVRRRGWIF